MIVERSGSRFPLHPDQYERHLPPADYEPELLPPLTDAEMDAMWAQEQEFRATAATTPIGKPHKHACGHRCISEACTLFALLNDLACEACRTQDEASGKYWAR